MSRKPETPARDNYEVGRGRPPTATRFRKGVSGNPSGKGKSDRRPKSPLEKLLDRGIMMTVDGKRQRVPVSDFALAQLLKMAGQGNLGALKELNRLSERLEAARALEEVRETAGPVHFSIQYAPDRTLNAVKLLEMASEEENGRTVLHLWTVQEGLRRRRRPLTEEERKTLARACPEFDAWYSTRG